jgi:hypothetical protein
MNSVGSSFPFIARNMPLHLTKGRQISFRTGKEDTALATAKSNVSLIADDLPASSALAWT